MVEELLKAGNIFVFVHVCYDGIHTFYFCNYLTAISCKVRLYLAFDLVFFKLDLFSFTVLDLVVEFVDTSYYFIDLVAERF